ncbi:uncharacterized protein [Dermacentor andersoni]|uniref:uncharacterized protein n=1 Tax=Dermacentor andersoni TaxID=34620 RepID=UPI002416C59C|nr:serine/arginine repetitive matrix protein 1-like [Dermacentor andersoni]
MSVRQNEDRASKENGDAVVTETVTTSVPMDSEALRATAGSTPPLHPRASPLHKAKPSKEKARAQTKGDKQRSVLSKARSRSRTSVSKLNGSRSTGTKQARKPAPPLPPPRPPSPAPPKLRKAQAVPAGPLATSTPSESLVSFSKEVSNDDLQLPLLPTRPTSSSQKKAPAVPEEVKKSSRSDPKGAAMQAPPKQAAGESSSGTQVAGHRQRAASSDSSRPSTKPFQTSRTSSVTTMYSPTGSGISVQTKAREAPDPYEMAPLLEVLVDDLREVTQDFGRRCSWQTGALEETSVPRLPFSSTTGSAQPAPAAARASGRPKPPEGGLDFFSFAVGTTASSMLFIVVLYFFKGLRSPMSNCGGQNCSDSSASYAPHN